MNPLNALVIVGTRYKECELSVTCYYQKNFQRAFGTFPLQGKALADALNCAIETGYRAIDTAQMYGNEAQTGECIANSGIPAGEFLVTTKVHPDNFDEALFLPSVEQSIKDLQKDVIDVLLLHWPAADGNIRPSLELLNRAADEGLAKHIGISNYTAQMMRDALTIVNRPLVTNQVEFHPLLNQSILLETSVETEIPLSSYCSVARGKALESPPINALAKQYDRTAAQIVLRWALQKGVTINTMSTKPENILGNYDVMDFTLSTIDMEKINALTQTNYRTVTKERVPWAPDWD